MHVNGPEALRYPHTHGLVLHRAVVASAERRGGAWAGVRRRAPPDARGGVATRAGPKASPPRQALVRWPPEGPAARNSSAAGAPRDLSATICAVVTRDRYTQPLRDDRYTRPLHTVVTHGPQSSYAGVTCGVTRGSYTRVSHAVVTCGVTHSRCTRSLHTGRRKQGW